MKRFFLLLFLLLAAPLYAATQDLNITVAGWADNSNNETGFKVFVRSSGGSYPQQPQTAVGANVTQATVFVAGDPGGTIYCAQVVAFNAAGNAAPSAETCSAPSPVIVVVPLAAGAPATVIIEVKSINP